MSQKHMMAFAPTIDAGDADSVRYSAMLPLFFLFLLAASPLKHTLPFSCLKDGSSFTCLSQQIASKSAKWIVSPFSMALLLTSASSAATEGQSHVPMLATPSNSIPDSLQSHCTSLNLLKQRLQRSGRTWGSNRSFTPISDRSMMTLQRFNFLAQTSLIVSEQLAAQIPDQLSLCAPMPRCLVMDTLPVLGSAKLFWGKMAMNSKGRS